MFNPDSLDALWASVQETERKHPSRPVMKAGSAGIPKPIQSSQFYTLPENWTEGRAVSMIHEETQTLLGNFREYAHRKDSSLRWQRTDGPCEITGVKYVSGPQWLFIAKDIPAPHVATSTRELLMPELTLTEIGVHAPTVPLTIFFFDAGIIRAELSEHTTFHSPDNRVIITFPARTNIYACLDVNEKVEIRKELMK